MQRIPFSRPATDTEFAAIMQIASCFNDAEWRGYPRNAVQFNTGDWDPATGIMTGDLDLGRPRFLIDQDTGQATEQALYREANFAILGDVTLGDVHDFADPPPGSI